MELDAECNPVLDVVNQVKQLLEGDMENVQIGAKLERKVRKLLAINSHLQKENYNMEHEMTALTETYQSKQASNEKIESEIFALKRQNREYKSRIEKLNTELSFFKQNFIDAQIAKDRIRTARSPNTKPSSRRRPQTAKVSGFSHLPCKSDLSSLLDASVSSVMAIPHPSNDTHKNHLMKTLEASENEWEKALAWIYTLQNQISKKDLELKISTKDLAKEKAEREALEATNRRYLNEVLNRKPQF